jgi:UDP-N-acetyl-2-amino-2-deoxyglucuronate dehydrogenase
MSQDPVRFGMIGCGEIATSTAKSICSCGNARAAAFFDVNADLAKDLAAQCKGDRVCATQEELLGLKDIDAVVISTPHFLHEPIALAAIAAGKHVLVEKPIGCTVEQGRRMVAAAAKAKRKLGVGYVMRYGRRAETLRGVVSSGSLGKLAAWAFMFCYHKPETYWTGGYSQRSKSDWRTRWETSGGGFVIMNLSHFIDLFRWVSGEEVTAVKAVGGVFNSPAGVEVEDTVFASLALSGGGIGMVGGGSAVPGHGPRMQQYIGTEGQITLGDKMEIYLIKGGKAGEMDVPAGKWTEIPEPAYSIEEDPRTKMAAAYADWVRGGPAFRSTGGEALKTLEVCEKIYRDAGLIK